MMDYSWQTPAEFALCGNICAWKQLDLALPKENVGLQTHAICRKTNSKGEWTLKLSLLGLLKRIKFSVLSSIPGNSRDFSMQQYQCGLPLLSFWMLFTSHSNLQWWWPPILTSNSTQLCAWMHDAAIHTFSTKHNMVCKVLLSLVITS